MEEGDQLRVELKVCEMKGMRLEGVVQGKALAQVEETAIFKSRGTGRMRRKASGWAGESFVGGTDKPRGRFSM